MNEWKNAQFSPSRSPSSRRASLSSSVRPIESRRARCDNALAVLPRTTRRERRARSSRSIVAHSRSRRRPSSSSSSSRRRPTDRPTRVHTFIRSYVLHSFMLCIVWGTRPSSASNEMLARLSARVPGRAVPYWTRYKSHPRRVGKRRGTREGRPRRDPDAS